MMLINPGPKARAHRFSVRGLQNVTIEFPVEEPGLLNRIIEKLDSNETFYVLGDHLGLRNYKIPVRVMDVFVPYELHHPHPTPAVSSKPPEARVTVNSVGPPVPYMQVSGYVTVEEADRYLADSHPNCRCSTITKEKKKMDPKLIKANRFYVGSERALRTGWGKPALAEAVEHAKELVERTGEDQFVVQIVRVVKKKEQPIVVETVK